MALTFGFFEDANLTTPVSTLSFTFESDGSTGPLDKVIYLGSTDGTKTLQAVSNPGVDPITVSVSDSAPGAGQETTAVKLATTQAGLDTATPGASLSLGTSISGGTANAQPIWMRVEPTDLTVGTSTELTLTTNDVQEV